jgi:Poly(ADP-ribose) polymerase catalytic domain
MRHNQSSKWHQDIADIAANYKPVNLAPLYSSQVATLYFPLAQLQSHTDFYLKRKGNLEQDDRDHRLISLVRDDPAKDVAIAACAHALSTPAVRELIIRECRVDPVTHDGLLPYLRAITGVHYANPTAISKDEEQLAQILILLSSSEAPVVGRHLNTYFLVSSKSELSELFLRPFVDKILRRACAKLGEKLDGMRIERQWKRGYEESSWLSDVLRDNPTAGQLLDKTFPTWRIWALWRPNTQRLARWECFTAEQRGALRDILALEGPDFIASEKPILREGLLLHLDANQPCSSISYGRLVLKLENGTGSTACTMLNGLLDALDAACSTSPSSLALFTHLCARNPVDNRVFLLLELVDAIRDPSVSTAVLNILTAEVDIQVAAAMQLLPSLSDGPGRELRDVLTPSIIESVEKEVLRMQNKFCEQLQRGKGEGLAMRLQAFGEILKDATWLQSSLSDGLRSALDIWPEKDDLEPLFKFRTDVQINSVDANSPLPRMIDAYLMACLAGRGLMDEEGRRTIEELVHFWQLRPKPDRRAVALALAQRSTISSGLRIQCLAQLKDLDRDFVFEVSKVLIKDTDMACVNFARVLASNWNNAETPECWRGILLSMIKQQNATLLDYSLEYLKIQPWFQWLNDLADIFGDSAIQNPPTILDTSLHLWNKRLSENYIPVLRDLENAMGSLAKLRWILAGWEDSENVIPVLDMLQAPEGGPLQPARLALMSTLAPDGSNGRQICQVFSRLTRMSPAGIQAYLRMLEVREKSTNQNAQAVLAVWLESPDLTPVDKGALKDMASILDMQTPTNGSALRTCLQDASNHLESEYSALLDEASRLESLRLTLKAHDPQKTSALLARSRIEDLSIIEDSRSGIPAELLDVVEGIGNGEFEMSFLLTHLKPLNLRAHGLSNARILVVRLNLGSGAAPPRFCMHIHPEPRDLRSSANTRNHSYHTISSGGSEPDNHVCHGRANRVTYQLCRSLHRYLSRGSVSLESIHKSLTHSIESLSQTCIVCGSPVGSGLWRSTTCKKDCSILFRRSDLEVRLVDLRLDPPVVDLLLSSVHAASVDGTNLLPQLLIGCPVSNAGALRQIVNGIPAINTLGNAQDLTSFVRGLGSQVEALLSWLCTSHRGFLATATGAMRIPSMPGVHQFLYANSAPELEKTFAARLGQQPSKVVFHGTSLDRLYGILRQGLRVQSGGSLQRHGALLGRGIYASDEPSTALDYASGTSSSGWSGSSFRNFRVLLGCELAGQSTSRNGVHVIPDSSMIMVRYIFLFPANTTAPIAAHVVPAMTSAYAILKSRSG